MRENLPFHFHTSIRRKAKPSGQRLALRWTTRCAQFWRALIPRKLIPISRWLGKVYRATIIFIRSVLCMNLHEYVHSIEMDAEGKEMKRIWERWHTFLSRLFDAINK